jgi:endo-1,4-beta-xylanase
LSEFCVYRWQCHTDGISVQWEFVEPELGIFNFSDGSVVANLATKNRQILRCHNLVWYSQLADWVTADTWDKKNLTEALIQHVTREASHWAGQCYAWDVVNEALNEDGTFRNDTFYNVLGQEYIKIAFLAAAAADPQAKLYYNDYNIEYAGPKSTAAQENIVKYLKDANVRIDGVGLQSHFIVGQTPSIEDQTANMLSFTDLGVDVAITELDIRLDLPANHSSLAQQSLDYQSTVGACLNVKRCVGITVWDFYDPVRSPLLSPYLLVVQTKSNNRSSLGYQASFLVRARRISGSRTSLSTQRIMG